MGFFARGVALGLAGIVVVVGCGGSDAGDFSSGVALDGEDGRSPPSGSATSVPGTTAPDDAGTDQADADDAGTAADADAAVSLPDASIDVDAGADSGPPPTTSFKLPAKLDDNGTCWQDEFPNPVCKPVPVTNPPIVKWDCAIGSTGMRVAELRVPPRSCLRVGGRFDPTKLKADGCFSVDCTPTHDVACRMWSNTSFTEEDSIRVHFKRAGCGGSFTAWWYPIEDCPVTPGCF